ncbi:MAG: c-type cytochrome biogenesis protein CcsB [Candidatus Riflebacteria bacterium]|nr:c-type cytochrome biogenesis protein CcsB [Candidatus Riflebacteria bacterium]
MSFTPDSCFLAAILAYIIAFVLYAFKAGTGSQKAHKFARILNYIGLAAATAGILWRWKLAGHPPLSNMYESMVTLSTMVMAVNMLFTRKHPMILTELILTAISIMAFGAASLFSSDIKPLLPILQSKWLYMHVSLAFLGEACFAAAFAMHYLYCFKYTLEPEDKPAKDLLVAKIVTRGIPVLMVLFFGSLAAYFANTGSPKAYKITLLMIVPLVAAIAVVMYLVLKKRDKLQETTNKLLPSCKKLETAAHQSIAVGYPLYAIGGLIFGMIWANNAWGRYWGWDPKETWALITTLVYSVYLHQRIGKKRSGPITAAISTAGFLTALFTLFGANFLISGLHSYL